MRSALFITLATFTAACGAPPPAPRTGPPAEGQVKHPAPTRRIVMEPIKLRAVPGSPGPAIEVLDATSLFDQGGRLLSAKKYRQALVRYDRLLKNFPDSRLVSSTLYNAGLCHEWLGEFDRAAARYKTLISKFGARKEAIDAGFRLGGCYAELRNWPASAEVFSALAGRGDISSADRIEALSRKGLAHFRLGDERMSRSTFEGVLRFHRGLAATERLDSDFFVGMAQYYLAAIPHVSFRKLKVDPKQMAQTLDDKARLLLVSQRNYIKTIKAKNPYWATAAGFQIGSLYREFYSTLLTSLPDFRSKAKKNAQISGVTVEEARKMLVQVYMEEVHKAVKPLLNKAIRVFEKNILVAERVGIRSNWVGKSRHQVNELKHLLSLPPAEAVKLVDEAKAYPEDQPAAEPPADPDTAPADVAPNRPTDKPPQAPGEQPGKAIL